MDLVRGASTRFTTNHSMNQSPVWSPDGKRVAYAADRGGTYNLYVKDVDGAASEELLVRSDAAKFTQDWSLDGRYLLYTSVTSNHSFDLWILPMVGEHKPFLFLETHSAAVTARFSPDGHWVMYSSNQSGNYEVYVQGFPTPEEKYQISKSGGMPRWRSDGKEIYYVMGNALMAADVIKADRTFVAGVPHLLFQATFAEPYNVSRDGQRFLIDGMPSSSEAPTIPITVVLNWTAILNEYIPSR
jgi:Tol biopolymer transport system component